MQFRVSQGRHERRRRSRRGTWRRLAAIAAVAAFAATLVAVALAGASVRLALDATKDLPPLARLERRPLKQTTFIYDRHGALIAQLHGATNRVVVSSRKIPRILKEATVAVEDKRFYHHHGVDFEAVVRALAADALAGHVVQGGSTITEQYIKNAYLGDEQTLARKVREAVLAWQLEDVWSKDRILCAYLNTIYYGQTAYGVQAAAETYFHRPASRLTLPQAALLAGLPELPGRYSPVLHPKAALRRRNLVLSLMQQQGYISGRRMARAQRAPLHVYRQAPSAVDPAASYFVTYVTQQLIHRYGVRQTFEGGLRVYTTLDLGWQHAAIESIKNTLNEPGDPAASLVSVDPQTGEIRAMVGGLDFARQKFNLAVQAERQPGSAMKPFVLTAAVLEGADPATTVYRSAPVHIQLPPGSVPPTWDVTTFDGTAYGPSTLVQATIRSDNTVYAQLVMDVGPKNVVRVAHAMGIRSPLQAVPSIALGSQVVNPLEMATAYSTFATEGVRHDPIAIERVVHPGGAVVDRITNGHARRVVPAGAAYVVDQILEKNVQEGTGVAAQIGRPAAGKTGTTSDFTDAWFCGFTPNLTTVVWVGYPADTSRSMTSVHGIEVVGGSFPAIIWHGFMTVATQHLPALEFPMPGILPHYIADWKRGRGAWLATISTPRPSATQASAAPTTASAPSPKPKPTAKPSPPAPTRTPTPTPTPTPPPSLAAAGPRT